LEPGTGWRTVYVKTRDAVGRSTVVSDTVYRGANVALDELSLAQAASTTDRVTAYNLDGGNRPYVQLSQNWFADDAFDTFNLWWGNGERVNDVAARVLGGSIGDIYGPATRFILPPSRLYFPLATRGDSGR
jgi:hypothetical protein